MLRAEAVEELRHACGAMTRVLIYINGKQAVGTSLMHEPGCGGRIEVFEGGASAVCVGWSH